MSEIVNKVKQSKLITVDLEKIAGDLSVKELDISQFLFKGMILREESFRDQLKLTDWSEYDNSWVALHCSTDAIVPSWAWMLVATCLTDHAVEIIYGTPKTASERLLMNRIESHDWESYRDKFVLLKGCSKADIPPGAYLEATKKLTPVVSKLMYGEACSNIPVYRK